MNTIKIKRGNSASLPVLSDGEMAFLKDKNRLIINNGGRNIEVGATTLTHSRSGTLHTLVGELPTSGLVTVRFKAVTNFVENDTFRIGTSSGGYATYTAKPTGGEAKLPDKAFITNDIVTAELDIGARKINFKIGGGGLPKEWQDIRTAEAGETIAKGDAVTYTMQKDLTQGLRYEDILPKNAPRVEIPSTMDYSTAPFFVSRFNINPVVVSNNGNYIAYATPYVGADGFRYQKPYIMKKVNNVYVEVNVNTLNVEVSTTTNFQLAITQDNRYVVTCAMHPSSLTVYRIDLNNPTANPVKIYSMAAGTYYRDMPISMISYNKSNKIIIFYANSVPFGGGTFNQASMNAWVINVDTTSNPHMSLTTGLSCTGKYTNSSQSLNDYLIKHSAVIDSTDSYLYVFQHSTSNPQKPYAEQIVSQGVFKINLSTSGSFQRFSLYTNLPYKDYPPAIYGRPPIVLQESPMILLSNSNVLKIVNNVFTVEKTYNDGRVRFQYGCLTKDKKYFMALGDKILDMGSGNGLDVTTLYEPAVYPSPSAQEYLCIDEDRIFYVGNDLNTPTGKKVNGAIYSMAPKDIVVKTNEENAYAIFNKKDKGGFGIAPENIAKGSQGKVNLFKKLNDALGQPLT